MQMMHVRMCHRFGSGYTSQFLLIIVQNHPIDEATAEHVYDAIADKNPEYGYHQGDDTDHVYSEIKTLPATRAADQERES